LALVYVGMLASLWEIWCLASDRSGKGMVKDFKI